jgi:hypothetical protein
VDLGLEFTVPRQSISSSLQANALGPGNPATNVGGSTNSADGVALGPSVAFTFRKKEDATATIGGGLFAFAAGSGNYPADPKNPALVSVGGWYLNFVVTEIPVAFSFKLSDHFAIGAAADFATFSFETSRAIFAPPNAATVDGESVSLYPPALQRRTAWGAGAHLGAYYHGDNGIGLGAMAKSPIFFPTLGINATTLAGQADPVRVQANAPMFVGGGGSYNGLKGWLFAADIKYAIYQGVTGFFGDSAYYQPDGSFHGLGYRNGWALSGAVQYELIEQTLMLRVGYQYNTAVLNDDIAQFNYTAGIIRHGIGGGFTFKILEHLSASASYVQSFGIPLEGPLVSPTNNQPIPNTDVRMSLNAPAFAGGLSFNY